MQYQITPKGTLVSADCARCGITHYAHEWASWDFNNDRDMLQAGTFTCAECGHNTDPDTYHETPRSQYAARLSMPGYLDCTDWSYDTNKRRLRATIQDMYGE